MPLCLKFLTLNFTNSKILLTKCKCYLHFGIINTLKFVCSTGTSNFNFWIFWINNLSKTKLFIAKFKLVSNYIVLINLYDQNKKNPNRQSWRNCNPHNANLPGNEYWNCCCLLRSRQNFITCSLCTRSLVYRKTSIERKLFKHRKNYWSS